MAIEDQFPAETLLVEQQIEAINRFPDQNPNPVLRITRDGHLLYANTSSEPIRLALGTEVGQVLPTVFERFVKSAGSPGSGLGLAIARDLVIAHAGTIEAISSPDQGTTITVTPPL